MKAQSTIKARAAMRASILRQVAAAISTAPEECDAATSAAPGHMVFSVASTRYRVVNTRESLQAFESKVKRCGGFGKQRTAAEECASAWKSHGLRGTSCTPAVNGFVSAAGYWDHDSADDANAAELARVVLGDNAAECDIWRGDDEKTGHLVGEWSDCDGLACVVGKFDGQWTVTEPRSGFSVGRGKTRNAAIETARAAVKKLGVDKAREAVERAMERRAVAQAAIAA
jgi:hypothetical protein